MTENQLKQMFKEVEHEGFLRGIKFMEQKIIKAYKTGNPVVVDGECYFIRDALTNLRDIIADIEESAKRKG